MRKTGFIAIGISLILTLAIAASVSPVLAQAGTAMDLINAVNVLRQNQGLTAYQVDNYLMGFAQSHSDYMASIGTWTHTRADGSTAFDYGIKENVAMGTNMSVQYCVYTVWSDWIHWQTMVAYSGGKVGAGVSISDGVVYYTLNMVPEGSSNTAGTTAAAGSGTTNTSQESQVYANIIAQVITSTPDKDGIIIHIVKYGETLWTIAEAYGVPIDQILRNSGLSPDTTAVFEGQQLLIQTATEPSATPSLSPTPDPGTPTPTKPRPTLTPFPTRTPAPTHTPTAPPSIVHQAFSNGKNVGIGMIVVSGLGLILVIGLGFIKKSSPDQ